MLIECGLRERGIRNENRVSGLSSQVNGGATGWGGKFGRRGTTPGKQESVLDRLGVRCLTIDIPAKRTGRQF